MSERSRVFNMGDEVLPETSLRGKKRKVNADELLTQFQVIHDSLQSLEKKLSAFSGNVSKIHRLHKKTVWHCYPLFRASNKKFACQLSQKIKQKYKLESTKRSYWLKMNNRPCDVSDPPQMSPSANSEASLVEASLSTQGPLQLEQMPVLQQPDLGLDQDPQVSIPYDTQAILTSKNIQLGKSFLSISSSSSSSSSSVQLSAAVSETVEEHQAGQSPVMADADSVEINGISSDHDSSFSIRNLDSDYIVDLSVPKQDFTNDPSTWSVEEVIEFMKYKDPQMCASLADLFRQQEIDGMALLLLKCDVMVNFLGITLGSALKLCYYIEKLKEGDCN